MGSIEDLLAESQAVKSLTHLFEVISELSES